MKIILPLENLQYDFPVPDQLDGLHHDSIAKICPFCLRLWAIIQVKSKHFSIQGTCCLPCWTPARILPLYAQFPGSLLDDCSRMGVQWELIEHFPQELVQREFKVHLKVFA